MSSCSFPINIYVFVNHRNVGTWSDRGCSVVKDKKKTVECACNHLTNFAILMQVKTFEVSLKNIFLFYFCKKRRWPKISQASEFIDGRGKSNFSYYANLVGLFLLCFLCIGELPTFFFLISRFQRNIIRL